MQNVSSGYGLTGILTIIFIVLKLTGLISWSWIWVLSPIWISLGVVLCIGVIILLCWFIFALIQKINKG